MLGFIHSNLKIVLKFCELEEHLQAMPGLYDLPLKTVTDKLALYLTANSLR